ncbi:heterodisulfide reductase-related iron-sulfur binding cluster [Denitromonas iodatirespirans]|uniref:Fe-S oxidoreductase n=1 Tax=Denitromonas iodatirespirans TaxID=2795389 RepID=A0A944D8I7_DENI1|nr:heterodisulfide reductase-related iron-sulfur binding cluster [Denitromonas iodatirespirans]MBT0960481.1 Fe-S oxidoreductase [Denitromonas iodatirespirans]
MASKGTVREGSLEAPTRHPLDWKNPDFWDAASLDAELERVFNICHGCRRCVSLCGAFPTLFDLVDEGPTGEVDGVPKARYGEVVDQCYLCDMCYMSKCPYVPPHEWNVDFPHLMLRAKAVERKTNGPRLRDTVLSSTDKTGLFAGIPVVTQTINAVNRSKPMRALMEKTLGVDAKAWLPSFATRKFRSAAGEAASSVVKVGERTPGKVVLFSTCFINYNEPGIGLDLVAILDHNEIPWRLAKKEACCGMPKLEQGDLDGVEALKAINIPQLVALAREGYAILTGVPSCTLMFKQELPLMFPDDADVLAVRDAMWEPFEYLVARHRDGLLKTDFKDTLGKIAYHVPCHGRVQAIGRKTEEFLKKIAGLDVDTTERCSGHAGTFGVKKEFHAMAMKIGRPVFRKMAESEPDFISSDCPLGGHHLAQGIAQNHQKTPELAHPISLVRRAYGI